MALDTETMRSYVQPAASKGSTHLFMFKRIANSNAALSLLGFVLAFHGWLVGHSNRKKPEAGFYKPFLDGKPCIIALWHGEHFMVPFLKISKEKLNILITTHRDGEILSRACAYYGLKCIRGSGGEEFLRKRALRAFLAMLRALHKGESIVMTADVPKVARTVGLGIVMLAQRSGRPIIPVAIATSRFFRLSNWDRTCINLPFGTLTAVRGEPIYVPRDADDASLEAARRAVEDSLNAITSRAYAIIGKRADGGLT